MFKFLRLYQGWILAIFGTFLVITFLLPQAIQGLFQSYAVSGGDWATVGEDENVTNGQLQMVRGELLVQDVIGTQFRTVPNLLGASKDPSYWYLLSREAEQAGLVGGPGVGRDYLASMSQQYIANGQQVSETTILLQMMGSSNFSDRQVYETLAKVQGVAQLATQFQNAARYSDERLRQTAAQLVLSADIDIVIIDAKADGSQSTTTTTTERFPEQVKGVMGALSSSGEGRMSEAVIGSTLFLIREHLIGFPNLLEAFFSLRVIRILVRVVLDGRLAVGFLYLRGRCSLIDPEDLIVVSF